MMRIRARRQHGVEMLAGGRLHVAQKSLLFRHAAPAVLHPDAAAIGEHEGSDVERVAEGVLGDMGVRVAVHAAAGIGGDLLDLDHARAEPAHRRRLHGIGKPAVERRDNRTGQRRGGFIATGPTAVTELPCAGPSRGAAGLRWRERTAANTARTKAPGNGRAADRSVRSYSAPRARCGAPRAADRSRLPAARMPGAVSDIGPSRARHSRLAHRALRIASGIACPDDSLAADNFLGGG